MGAPVKSYCIGHSLKIDTSTKTWTCACGARGDMPIKGHYIGEDTRVEYMPSLTVDYTKLRWL